MATLTQTTPEDNYSCAANDDCINGGPGTRTKYAYDSANQLTGITYQKGATTIGTLTYSYDAAGGRTAVAGTLAQVNLPAVIGSAVYNANNQLLQWNGQTYAYDLNGNLTSDGQKTLAWNSRDQLTTLAGTVTASFQYDGFGRRVARTINGTNTGFVYDGLNFVQELTGATPKANLLTGLGIDEVFARTQNNITSSFLTDAQGSAVVVADGSGVVTTSYTYEPYGAVTQTGAANENTQQFTARENDGTGLMYYRARYYIANCGRFISEDPIGVAGGMNLYAYAGGDPVSFNDPLGFGPCLPNVGAFVNAHLQDAQTLANSLGSGVTPAEILAVAGNETGYGGSFARFGNFFGLHGSGPAGTYYTTQNHTPVAMFPVENGFLLSGQAFVNNVKPYMKPGMDTDPLAFFTILNQHGYGTGNSGYPAYMIGTPVNRGPYTLVNACM